MHYAFLNDTFVNEENCNLHYSDLSIQRGYGIFEFFRLQENKPLFLEDHLNRFYFSAGEMNLKVNYNREELKQILNDLIQKNNLPGSGIRITLTGGCSTDGMTLTKPNLIITQNIYQPPTKIQINEGIKLITHAHQRQLPQVKSIDYLMAIWLRPLIQNAGADDVLYYLNGLITECPRSNIFIITEDETIATPKEGILNGITRMKILQLAGKYFKVEERPVTLNDLQTASEVFITSTTKQILPVYSIDNKVYHKKEMTLKLQAMFADYIAEQS